MTPVPPREARGSQVAGPESRQNAEVAPTATGQASVRREVYRFPATGQGARVTVIDGEPVLTTQIRITPDGLAYLRRRLGGIRGEGA